MADFTLSGASTLMGCRFPYRADVVMPPESADDAARKYGTDFHDGSAQFINAGKEPEADLGPAWLSARVWIKANWKPSWVAEPAYGWDPTADKSRFLGVDIAREYEKHGKLAHEVGGTLDVCSVEGDTVYVYEFGTGYDVSHKHEQLRLQCLVATRAHRCSKAVGQLVRFADDGAYPSPPVELDEFALAAIAGEFAEYLSEVDGAAPVPGEHCQRCNLAPVCPAAATIVQALVPVESLVKPGWGLVIANADHARYLLDMARLVSAAAEAVKTAVKAYVPEAGLELSDGSLLIEGTRDMPRTDHKRMAELARTLGATPEQIESCNYVAIESSGLRVKKPAKKRRAA